jgi:hypothetical protein
MRFVIREDEDNIRVYIKKNSKIKAATKDSDTFSRFIYTLVYSTNGREHIKYASLSLKLPRNEGYRYSLSKHYKDLDEFLKDEAWRFL